MVRVHPGQLSRRRCTPLCHPAVNGRAFFTSPPLSVRKISSVSDAWIVTADHTEVARLTLSYRNPSFAYTYSPPALTPLRSGLDERPPRRFRPNLHLHLSLFGEVRPPHYVGNRTYEINDAADLARGGPFLCLHKTDPCTVAWICGVPGHRSPTGQHAGLLTRYMGFVQLPVYPVHEQTYALIAAERVSPACGNGLDRDNWRLHDSLFGEVGPVCYVGNC